MIGIIYSLPGVGGEGGESCPLTCRIVIGPRRTAIGSILCSLRAKQKLVSEGVTGGRSWPHVSSFSAERPIGYDFLRGGASCIPGTNNMTLVTEFSFDGSSCRVADMGIQLSQGRHKIPGQCLFAGMRSF